MKRRLIGSGVAVLLAVWCLSPIFRTVVLQSAASFPTAVKSFTTKNASDTIQAAHVNDLQDEVAAVESDLFNGMARVRMGGSTLTISADAVTVTKSLHAIDTEAAAATDNLSTISAGSGVAAGHLLVVYAANAARVVTVKDSVGNITLNGGDYTLSSAKQSLLLRYDGTNWVEVARAAGGLINADLLFTDATYDIGKTGAPRPRDGVFSRNFVIGGTLGVTGQSTLGYTVLNTNSGGVTLSLAPSSGNAAINLTGSGGDTIQFAAGTSGNSVLKNTSNSSLGFGTNNLTRFNLTAAGNLEMASGSTITMAAGADLILDIPSGRSLLTKVNGTTKQTTDSSGNLTLSGTGTGLSLTPGSGAAVLNLNGFGGDTLQIAASTAGNTVIKVTSNSALLFGTNNTTYVTLSSTGFQRWHAYGAGTLTTDGSGNITAVSDARFKDRIAPLPYGLAEVRRLRPIQYGYNATSKLDRDHLYGGFLAQDVAAVMPLAVGHDPQGFLTLADRPIIGALVNAVQTLDRRVAVLEARLAALERRAR